MRARVHHEIVQRMRLIRRQVMVAPPDDFHRGAWQAFVGVAGCIQTFGERDRDLIHEILYGISGRQDFAVGSQDQPGAG